MVNFNMAWNQFDHSGSYRHGVPLPEVILEPEGSTRPATALPGRGDSGGRDGGEVGAQRNSTESVADSLFLAPQVGKPQVIVRIRPSPNIDSAPTFEVDQQTKTIQIRVDRGRKGQELGSHKSPPGFIYFPADNVLENSSQEDTFNAVGLEVVEKAMMGIPGMIVGIGPEVSGKSFSLFGLNGRYQNRGIAARALEKMFEIKDRQQGETDFKFGMGVIEVRRERIRDLLTLSPNEINEVGELGPKGMYIEEVDCMEHGLGLLLRALIGQKLIHKEPYERYHTVVYLEIVGVSPMASELVQFQSRITFAEIASAPYRSDSKTPNSPRSLFYGPNPDFCVSPSSTKFDTKFKSKQAVFPERKCCNPGYTKGPLAESIAVRRDTFAMEQIFLKANEMYRIRKYFAKLETLGLSMIASEKRKLSSGHNFRQNRLAHCLKDILDTNTEIRIVLHVRPDKAYLKASLEAMRFAERARLVPSNLDGDPNKGKPNRTEDQILQEVITDIAPELMHPSNVETLNSEKMRVIQEQAVHYFENNIDAMKVCSKEKVKRMFENFRVLWNFLWELELNVTLRKAEDEMKLQMQKMGTPAVTTEAPTTSGKSPSRAPKEGRGSDAGKTHATTAIVETEDEDQAKEIAIAKKSSKKLKKDRERKKRKERHTQQQNKRSSSNELKAASDDGKNPESGGVKRMSNPESTGAGEDQTVVAAPTEKRRSSLATSENASAGGGEEPVPIQGETEVSFTSPPGTTEQLLATNDGLEVPVTKASMTSIAASNKKGIAENNLEAADAMELDGRNPSTNSNIKMSEPSGDGGGVPGGNIKQADSMDRKTLASTQQPILSSTTHIHHAAALRNSTFYVRGGFADLKSHNVWGGSHVGDQKPLTEEEKAQLAALQEQQISNFEEMKKVARRQAIHLLRTGVRRPQWMSLF